MFPRLSLLVFTCLFSLLSTLYLNGQSRLEGKWGIQLSPNHYFSQNVQMEKKGNAFVKSRNGLSGSAYIFRNFTIKKAPKLSFTVAAGINIYPLLDVVVGYDQEFRPDFVFEEIDRIILKDKEVIYPDLWFQLNYNIFKSIQINSAFGAGILPIKSMYENYLNLKNEKYGRFIYFYLNSEFNPVPISLNYKIGFTKEIRFKRFKLNLTPAYVRGLNPFLKGDIYLMEEINVYRSKAFKTYLNYVEFSIGVQLLKKKKIVI